jgi:thioredoxin 1
MELNDDNYTIELAGVHRGVVLFHKKLCPHCLNLSKVIEKFRRTQTETAARFIDSEDNPVAMKSLKVERVPTLFIIKDGRVAARHEGLMNPRELKALYLDACGRAQGQS